MPISKKEKTYLKYRQHLWSNFILLYAELNLKSKVRYRLKYFPEAWTVLVVEFCPCYWVVKLSKLRSPNKSLLKEYNTSHDNINFSLYDAQNLDG